MLYGDSVCSTRMHFSFILSRRRRRAMKDILWLIVIVMTSLAWCSIAEAQQPKKVPLLGYLSGFDQATDSARSESIRSALLELGYIEKQNIEIEYRYTE